MCTILYIHACRPSPTLTRDSDVIKTDAIDDPSASLRHRSITPALFPPLSPTDGFFFPASALTSPPLSRSIFLSQHPSIYLPLNDSTLSFISPPSTVNILSPVLSVSSRYLHASPCFVCYIIIVIIIRRVTVRVSTKRRLRVCRKCSSQPSAFFYLFFSRSKRKTPANYYTPPRCLGPSLVIPPSYIKKK